MPSILLCFSPHCVQRAQHLEVSPEAPEPCLSLRTSTQPRHEFASSTRAPEELPPTIRMLKDGSESMAWRSVAGLQWLQFR